MINLGLLINTNIINEFGLNKIKNLNSKERNKILAIIVGSIVLIGYLIYAIFKLCLDVSDLLILYNQMDLLLLIGFVGTVLFSLFTTLYKSSSYLFEAKDFEMLISLPLKESTILISKIFMLLISNYLFTAPIILIPAIVYSMKVNVSIFFYVNLILMFLCTPLIPMIISSIISFFLGNISSKIKYKNAILIIGSIILLVVYMLLVTQMEEIGKSILVNSTSINEAVKKVYFLSYYYIDGLTNNSFLSVIKFIGLSLGLFLIFVNLFSKQFKLINSRMNEDYKTKKYEAAELKTSNIIEALLQKEIKRYFSSYIYVLNSSMGMVLLSIFSISLVILGADKVSDLLQLNLDFTFIKIQLLGIILFCIVTSCTTYCSISIEGKNLWIIKSLPIKEIDIFKGKIGLNLLITIPISIICFILISLRMKFDFNFILIGSLVIISVELLVAILGLFLNLLYPNLDWKNEVAVVKRSFSMIAVMLLSALYISAYAFIYFKFTILNLNIFLSIAVIITLAITLILWNLIKTKGVEIFRKL